MDEGEDRRDVLVEKVKVEEMKAKNLERVFFVINLALLTAVRCSVERKCKYYLALANSTK